MRTSDLAVGPSRKDWANANITVSEYKTAEDQETLYELRKTLLVNGVTPI